jgi:hypothetical protein
MENEELGALSAVAGSEEELTPEMLRNPLAVINYAEGLRKKRYDEYAERLKAARMVQQAPVQSNMSRLASALMAAGAPNAARSNWVALQQGVENWNKSGATQEAEALKQRQLAAADEAELAKAQFEMGGEREKLLLKYGEPPKQIAGYTAQTQVINGDPYVIYAPKDPASGLKPFSVKAPPGSAPTPQEPGAAPATPAQAGAVVAGARPTGKPISQAEFLALPPDQRAGVEFMDATGAVKRGTSTGGTVDVAPAEVRPATREEAMARGFFNGTMEGTKFVPAATDETNRVPDISALDADVNRIDANINDMRALQKALRDVVPLINSSTVGLGGFIGAFVPGTPAYKLASTLKDYIGGNIAFDALQNMRVNSPTGGALGNVAIEELRALKQSAGNLNPNAGEESLRRGVLDVLAKYDAYIRAAQQQMGIRQQLKSDVLKARNLGVVAPSAPASAPIKYDREGNRIR